MKLAALCFALCVAVVGCSGQGNSDDGQAGPLSSIVADDGEGKADGALPRVTLPVRMSAQLGTPGDEVTATLRWQDGSSLSRKYTLLQGPEGRGLLVDSIGLDYRWGTGTEAEDMPPTQPATLDVTDPEGNVLAHQEMMILSWNDPGTVPVKLYFIEQGKEDVTAVTVRGVKTSMVGTQALNLLLRGAPQFNEAGMISSIPSAKEVMSYAGRGEDWGYEVKLLGLTVKDGVATANFSKELHAYGGGSLRVELIAKQIEQTLLQFPTVKSVVIAVEGQTEGVLEP